MGAYSVFGFKLWVICVISNLTSSNRVSSCVVISFFGFETNFSICVSRLLLFSLETNLAAQQLFIKVTSEQTS